MKVDNVGRPQQIIESTRSGSRPGIPSEGGPFKRLLDKELDAASTGASQVDRTSGTSTANLHEVLLHRSLPELTGRDTQASETLDAGIGDMEGFVQALGDKTISPKTVDRIVQGLHSKLEGVQDTLSELQADHPLRLIADELNVLSYVESVKWKRGDYI